MSALHRGYRTFAVHHQKSLIPVFSIDHIFVNLESGKMKYCFGKRLEKVLNFGSKNLYEPCTPFLYHVGNKYQGKIVPECHFLSVFFF